MSTSAASPPIDIPITPPTSPEAHSRRRSIDDEDDASEDDIDNDVDDDPLSTTSWKHPITVRSHRISHPPTPFPFWQFSPTTDTPYHNQSAQDTRRATQPNPSIQPFPKRHDSHSSLQTPTQQPEIFPLDDIELAKQQATTGTRHSPNDHTTSAAAAATAAAATATDDPPVRFISCPHCHTVCKWIFFHQDREGRHEHRSYDLGCDCAKSRERREARRSVDEAKPKQVNRGAW